MENPVPRLASAARTIAAVKDKVDECRLDAETFGLLLLLLLLL